ncbi:rCG25250 [Rattus norvegicus]|uniref:RCG25250 n=1 Tax=Rattus norvegicus TaxID=10116 RepID=A6I1G4_RAT|nr:rCG25250 [Rattus norvegicus]
MSPNPGTYRLRQRCAPQSQMCGCLMLSLLVPRGCPLLLYDCVHRACLALEDYQCPVHRPWTTRCLTYPWTQGQ